MTRANAAAALLCLASALQTASCVRGARPDAPVESTPPPSPDAGADAPAGQEDAGSGAPQDAGAVSFSEQMDGGVPKSADLAPPPPTVTTLHVTFIDVGQGDAILIQHGTTDILVDTGEASCAHLLQVLSAKVTGPIETLFITHPHDDHFDCGNEVMAAHVVQKIITNGEGRGPPRDANMLKHWKEFLDAAVAEGVALEWRVAGDVITPAAGLTFTVLATGSPTGGRFKDNNAGPNINNDSLVMMMQFAGKRVLFTGDIEEKAGEHLVADHCPNAQPANCHGLRADVLKVPHHASASFHPEFYEAVSPTWGVVSAAYNKGPSHYLPRKVSIAALQALGAGVYSTSADGMEDVVLDIRSDGAMTWTAPLGDVFAWDKVGTAYKAWTMRQGQ